MMRTQVRQKMRTGIDETIASRDHAAARQPYDKMKRLGLPLQAFKAN